VTVSFVDLTNENKSSEVCGCIVGFPLTDINNGKSFMGVIFKPLGRKISLNGNIVEDEDVDY